MSNLPEIANGNLKLNSYKGHVVPVVDSASQESGNPKKWTKEIGASTKMSDCLEKELIELNCQGTENFKITAALNVLPASRKQ